MSGYLGSFNFFFFYLVFYTFNYELSESREFGGYAPKVFVVLLESVRLLFVVSGLLYVRSKRATVLFKDSAVFPIALSKQ